MVGRDYDYTPIDTWAETKHPKLLANLQAHLDIYEMGVKAPKDDPKMTDEEKYVFIRQLMMYIRQEFEG